MGLFGSDKWECNSCGATFQSNPSKCSECGHTVLTQYREDEPPPTQPSSRQSTSESASQKVVWYCEKCKQKHTEEPERCKVCGTEQFKQVGENSPRDGETEQYTHPDDDVETISNVREATSSPVEPDSGNSNLGFYAGILILLILLGLTFYVL